MNFCLTQENTSQSDCSDQFEGIHPAFTILQACAAVAFVMVAVTLNLILCIALLKFHHFMDEAFVLCASVSIANVVVSLFLGTGVFLSSATRSWPLGYVGCQLFGFLSYYPMLARWVTLGMISIDRFCRVFFPFSYMKHSKTVLKVLFIFPWVVVLPITVLSFFEIYSRYEFFLLLPSCFHNFNCNGSLDCIAVTRTNVALILCTGSVLPTVLYTILYFKSRKLFKAMQTPHLPSQQRMDDGNRQKKATKTFTIMVLTFSCYSAAVVMIRFSEVIPVIKDVKPLQFLIGDIILTYNITDFLIVWKNTEGKRAIKKLINTVLGKEFCSSSIAILSALIPGSSSTNDSAPVATSTQPQVDVGILTPTPTSVEAQTGSTSLAHTPALRQKPSYTTSKYPVLPSLTSVSASGEAKLDTPLPLPISTSDPEQQTISELEVASVIDSGQDQPKRSFPDPAITADQEQ